MSTNKTNELTQLDELAFQSYCKQVNAIPTSRVTERLVLQCFKKADDFVQVRDKFRRGELTTTPPERSRLADCSSPNLPKTHPYNLVSQRFGDLSKVATITKFLDANPPTDDEQEKIVAAVNRQFPELGWDLPSINIARLIFPTYCN